MVHLILDIEQSIKVYINHTKECYEKAVSDIIIYY